MANKAATIGEQLARPLSSTRRTGARTLSSTRLGSGLPGRQSFGHNIDSSCAFGNGRARDLRAEVPLSFKSPAGAVGSHQPVRAALPHQAARARAASSVAAPPTRLQRRPTSPLWQSGVAVVKERLQHDTDDFVTERDAVQRALSLSLQEANDLEAENRLEAEAAAAAFQAQDDWDAILALQVAEITDAEECSPTDLDEDTHIASEACDDNVLSVPSSFADGGESSSSSSPKPSLGLIRTFAPRRWLTDASISHVYEHLMQTPTNHEEGNACFLADARRLPEDILVIDAATTFWLAMQASQSGVREMIAPLKIEERQLVLCPLNNSRERGRADGGSHWGLLVWDRRRLDTTAATNRLPQECVSDASAVGRFLYYDSGSFRGMCQAQADRLASKLAGQRVKTTLGECARQTNGYDCGMYVLMFSEIILASFMQDLSESSTVKETKMTGRVPVWEKRLRSLTPSEVTERRASIFHWLRGAVGDEEASTAPKRRGCA